MKKHKQVVLGFLFVVMAACAAYTTLFANRLQKRFTRLEASHHQLLVKHRLLKESFLQFVGTPSTSDQAMHKVIAVLEKLDDADVIYSTAEDPMTRVNSLPRNPSQ